MKNVVFLGGRDYEQLPSYLKAMQVAILPNLLNEYTKSMFPMKFFEYLAAGRPVVSVQLDALSDYGNVVALCSTAEEFVVHLDAAIEGKSACLEDRLSVAREQTYEIRTKRMLKIINEKCRINTWPKI
jgi:glycosyltransferase involved in cell wall biosynthesis